MDIVSLFHYRYYGLLPDASSCRYNRVLSFSLSVIVTDTSLNV